jgi:glycosyltransferase involved in cell wall biosynthesis
MGLTQDTGPSKRSMRASQRGCALIPAYKEAGRIGPVVARVLTFLPDVVVVDDGSDDATAEEAKAAGAVVCRHEVNRGKGAALATGMAYAKSKGFAWVITLDADGQHDPADIPKFVEAYVRTGIPVLVGNRMGNTAAMPRVRLLTNRFMSNLLSREMGQFVPDTQCGYRFYRIDVLPFLATQSDRFAAESESLLHVAARGLAIGAVPISVIYLEGRESNIRPFHDTVRFFSMLMNYRRAHRRPSQE